jgi:hypothetical protein
MKMLMLIVDEAKKEELEVFLRQCGVDGYTEIPRAIGLGTTGPRLGSRAYPDTSAVIFTVLEDDALARLVTEIKQYCHECGDRLRMAVWGVEELA